MYTSFQTYIILVVGVITAYVLVITLRSFFDEE